MQSTTTTQLVSDQAVEIAATLEGSIVDVRYLTRTRPRPAWPFAIAGALCALLAAVAFARGVSVARANAAALHQWTEIERRPVHEFRPAPVSRAFDALAALGFAGAVLGFGTALWRRRPRGDDTAYRTAEGAPIAMLGERGAFAVDADGTPVPLAPGATARTRRGVVDYRIRAVAAPARHGDGVLAGVDGRTLAFVGGSALAHGLLLALIWNIPPSPKQLGTDPFGDRALRYVPASIVAMETSLPEPETMPTDGDGGALEDAKANGREAGEEGKMGNPDSQNATGRHQIAKRAEAPRLARAEAMNAARNTGILRVYGASAARDPFAHLTGDDWTSSGLADRDIYGGMIGDKYQDMYSDTWGSGVRGVGPGGGGDNWGIIGTDPYATIGESPHGGTRIGPPGLDGLRPKRRDQRVPEPTLGPPDVIGEYDKAIIRRYIKKQRARLRHCYERQLVVDAELAGTVVARFAFNDQGAVVSSTATGLPGVDDCVADVIASIQFPKPGRNDMFRVTYPFHFRPAGQ